MFRSFENDLLKKFKILKKPTIFSNITIIVGALTTLFTKEKTASSVILIHFWEY